MVGAMDKWIDSKLRGKQKGRSGKVGCPINIRISRGENCSIRSNWQKCISHTATMVLTVALQASDNLRSIISRVHPHLHDYQDLCPGLVEDVVRRYIRRQDSLPAFPRYVHLAFIRVKKSARKLLTKQKRVHCLRCGVVQRCMDKTTPKTASERALLERAACRRTRNPSDGH